jgi:phosphatidylserine/phosphatidylglycerophosphate/cardiolipin synthase-like enzyme
MTSKPTTIAVTLLLVGVFVGIGIGSSTSQNSSLSPTVTQQITVTATATLGLTITEAGPDIVDHCFTSGYGSTSNCASLIVDWVGQAKSSIHILMYSITLAEVTQALIQAAARGVDVKIVMDSTQARSEYSQYSELTAAGLNVRLSHGAYEMHDKAAVIDGHIILTGSFNWTQDANYNNDENLLILSSQTLGAAYEQEFQVVWSASA